MRISGAIIDISGAKIGGQNHWFLEFQGQKYVVSGAKMG